MASTHRWDLRDDSVVFDRLVIECERAKTRLGFSPVHSNRDALIRNFEWYLANRDRIAAQTGVTHRVPWKRGALRLLKMVI